MKILLLIGSGSFLGGVGRYLLSRWVLQVWAQAFPLGTLLVNLLGCFLIGLVFALAEKYILSKETLLFLTTGVLGGFTTFSAFSYEAISLMRNGQSTQALLYLGASVLLGLAASWMGLLLGKLLF